MLRSVFIALVTAAVVAGSCGVASAQDRASNVPVAGATAIATTVLPGDGGLRVTVEAAVGERLRVFGGGSAGPTLVEGAATLGARYALTTERRDGVATFVGTRYSAAGHEGRPELAVTAAAYQHVGALALAGSAEFARELDQDQRDAELALAALRALSSRVALGVAGHATIDLDAGRADGGEIRWEARGGPAATVRVGRAALFVQGGAVAVATPQAIARGPFALASVAGWF